MAPSKTKSESNWNCIKTAVFGCLLSFLICKACRHSSKPAATAAIGGSAKNVQKGAEYKNTFQLDISTEMSQFLCVFLLTHYNQVLFCIGSLHRIPEIC